MHESIEHHIEAIAVRTAPDAMRLTQLLHLGCWPSGSADRVERAALDAVDTCAPMEDGNTGLVCLCASGRCPICN
jgi:hypothetical protein